MFQHRHYVAIAAVIREARTQARRHASEHGRLCGVYDVEQAMSNAFAQNNGRFDRERFARACDPSQTPMGRDRG